MESDKIKALDLVQKLEDLIKEKAEEKRKAVNLEEQELQKMMLETEKEILRKEAMELEWKELRVENPYYREPQKIYLINDLLYDAWKYLSKANETEFRIEWIHKTRTLIIPYVEYGQELLFLNKDVKTLGLPYLTETTVALLLKMNILVKIKERYLSVVKDMIKNPKEYGYKMKDFRVQTHERFTGLNVAEYFLSCMDE